MKRILTILFVLVNSVIFSQATLTDLNLVFDISESNSYSSPFVVKGTVLHSTSEYNGNDINVGDLVYFQDGTTTYSLPIVTIDSQSYSYVELQLLDISSTVSYVPTGRAALIRTSNPDLLPVPPDGIPSDLEAGILNDLRLKIQGGVTAAEEITDYTGGIISSPMFPPAVSPSSYTGKTWRNSMGVLYRSDGVAWTPIGGAAFDTLYTDATNQLLVLQGPNDSLSTSIIDIAPVQQITGGTGISVVPYPGGVFNIVNAGDLSNTNEIELPSQVGNNLKALYTNGTSPYWGTVASSIDTFGVYGPNLLVSLLNDGQPAKSVTASSILSAANGVSGTGVAGQVAVFNGASTITGPANVNDWNVTDVGRFQIVGANGNGPVFGSLYYGIHIPLLAPWATNYGFQIAGRNTGMFYRNLQNGTWEPWYQVLSDKNINADVVADWDVSNASRKFTLVGGSANGPGTIAFGASFPHTVDNYNLQIAGRIRRFWVRTNENSAYSPWTRIATGLPISGNIPYWGANAGVSGDTLTTINTFNMTGGNLRLGLTGTAAARLHVVGADALSTGWTAQFHNSTGTSNSLMIRNDGNIGLGTNAPTVKLHSSGSGEQYWKLETTSNGYSGILFKNGTQTENRLYFNGSAGTTGCFVLGHLGGGGGSNKTLAVTGGMSIGVSYASTSIPQANSLIVEGNTGFGTISPTRKLHVAGGNPFIVDVAGYSMDNIVFQSTTPKASQYGFGIQFKDASDGLATSLLYKDGTFMFGGNGGGFNTDGNKRAHFHGGVTIGNGLTSQYNTDGLWVQGATTLGYYPNTLNSAGSPVNILSTSSTGVLESHTAAELVSAGGGLTGAGSLNRIPIFSGTNTLTTDANFLISYSDANGISQAIGSYSNYGQIPAFIAPYMAQNARVIDGTGAVKVQTASFPPSMIALTDAGGLSYYASSTNLAVNTNLFTNSYLKWRVLKNGDMGVGGVVTPSAKLHVVGSGNNSTTWTAQFHNNATNNALMIRDDGNIGIGTASPAQKLHVQGTARITDSDGTATTIMGRDGDGDVSILGLGSGLSITSGVLNVTASGATNLAVTGTSSPLTLTSDTGTDVTFTAGTNVTLAGTSGNITINATEVDGSVTNEIQNLSLTGQTLAISGGTGATLPVIGITAGTGITATPTAGNFTITNTGDTNAADDLTTSTFFDGDIEGTWDALTLKTNVVGEDNIIDGSITAFKLAAQAASNGQVLTYGGALVGWVPSSAVGDVAGPITNLQIGANAVGTTELNNGAVTMAKINQASATTGQVITWNGTAWAPATPTTGPTYTAGTGINISSNVITNTGDTNAADDLTTSTSFSGDVTGLYNNLQIAANAVGTTELADNSVSANKIGDSQVTMAKINQSSATSGQIISWNGTTWAPSNIGYGGATDAIGTAESLTVTKIQNRGIATTAPTTGQVLAWSGTLWAPASPGLTSLNGQTGSTQTFFASSTGSDFGITSSGNVHTFVLPTANATQTGKLTSSDWTAFSNKIGGSGTTDQLAIFTGSGTISSSSSLSYASSTLTVAGDISPTGKLKAGTLGTSPTVIVGRNASNELSTVGVGAGLDFTGGTLSASNFYTADGTLTGSRTVTTGNLNIAFDASTSGTNNANPIRVKGISTSGNTYYPLIFQNESNADKLSFKVGASEVSMLTSTENLKLGTGSQQWILNNVGSITMPALASNPTTANSSVWVNSTTNRLMVKTPDGNVKAVATLQDDLAGTNTIWSTSFNLGGTSYGNLIPGTIAADVEVTLGADLVEGRNYVLHNGNDGGTYDVWWKVAAGYNVKLKGHVGTITSADGLIATYNGDQFRIIRFGTTIFISN